MQSQKFKISHHFDAGIETARNLNYNNITSQLDINLQNAHFGKRKKQRNKKMHLHEIIFKYKVRQHVQNFIKNLKTNSVYRPPYQNQHAIAFKQLHKNSLLTYLQQIRQKISKKQGFSIGNIGLIIWSLINIIQVALMVFIFSIIITFPQTQNFSMFTYLRIISIVLYLIDMFFNFTVIRYEKGKYLQKLGQISSYYIKNQFAIDMISLLVFPIDVILTVQKNIQMFLFLFAVIKLGNNIKKFDKFQYLLINTSGKQHYFGLVKVFIANLTIAHFLSILLNFMALLNPQQNWQQKLNIVDSVWYIKYIWGYYWGTNIMLTVGFGDICATNYQQAIVLIFIEIFSCITLSYNINYVGSLISSLRQNNKIKKRKLKTFHKMCRQNSITFQMEEKVTNLIQEQYRIKQTFQYETHDQILQQLPLLIQKDFRKLANRNLFQGLSFFNNLSKKGITLLSELVSRKVCHPQEIILKRGQTSQMLVLQNGSISLTCRIKSSLDGRQIENIQVNQSQKPKMVSLDFIKNKILNYNVKSNSYSVLFYLSRDDFMNCLRNNDLSFQTICMIKDKDENIFKRYGLKDCQLCIGEKHTKFECNRLHFMPLVGQIILKYLHKENKIKQDRNHSIRKKLPFSSILMNNRTIFDHKRYLTQNFDDHHFTKAKQIQMLYNIKPIQTQIIELQANKQLKSTNNQLFLSTISNLKVLLDHRQLYKLQNFIQEKVKNKQQFWNIEVDRAQNYNYYFTKNNPSQLDKIKKFYKRSRHLIFNF